VQAAMFHIYTGGKSIIFMACEPSAHPFLLHLFGPILPSAPPLPAEQKESYLQMEGTHSLQRCCFAAGRPHG